MTLALRGTTPHNADRQVNPISNCRLCENATDLRESHIVPKFVFRWLKSSSPTGIRQAVEPNRRVQDGWKRPFLCGTCEAILNKHETPFASKLFVPFHERAPSVRATTHYYGDWCLPFCVSMSWRVLRAAQEDGTLPNLSGSQHSAVERALGTWRDFLLGRRRHPGEHVQYVLPLGVMASAPAETVSPYQNRYFLRTIQIDVLADEDSVFVFSKLGRLAVLGFVTPPKHHWRGWKVHLRKGSFPIQGFAMPNSMIAYLKAAADAYGALYERMSSRQQELARSGIRTAVDQELEAFIAFEADVRISGTTAVRGSRNTTTT